MTTNFLSPQMPNRKGNISSKVPSHKGGATAVTGPKHGVSIPSGNQGAPKASGNVYPSSGKALVSTPKCYCTKTDNDGYLKRDSQSYLK